MLLQAASNRAEYRAAVLPTSNITRPLDWLVDFFGGTKTASGIEVDPDKAISLSTFFMGKSLISEGMAQIPFAPHIKEQVNGRTNDRVFKEHFSYRLVSKRPHPWISSHNFRKVMQHWAILHDNAYAIIQRNGNGQAVGMFPWHPKMVRPQISKSGRLVYEITKWDGTTETLDFMSVFHIVGNTDNGITGKSRMGIAKEGIGKAIAAQQFGAKFFGKGINPSGFIRTQKLLKDKDAVERLKSGFAKRHGGQNGQFSVGVLEDQAEWIPNETDPEKAQLTETEKVDARMAANILVMPVTMLNQLERGTYNNIEQLTIQFVNHTLIPWGINWEQECWFKLLTEREKREDNIGFKFNFNGLLRGDMEARANFYESLAKVGAYSPNRILELEDENGYDGGDVHIVSPGATSVEQINNPETQEDE